MRRYIDSLSEDIDYSDPKYFDQLDAVFPAMQSSARYQPSSLEEDRGSIAWGAAISARAYIQMYKNTLDERYLRRFVGYAEQFTLSRDFLLDKTDYRGHSGKVWRSGRPYSSNKCVIAIGNSGGRLEIRSKSAVTVQIIQNNETLDMIFYGEDGVAQAEFTDLTLNPNDERFIGTELASHGWRQPLIAARIVGSIEEGALPAGGTFLLEEQFYVAAVETGQICTALLEFCILVSEEEELSKFREYSQRFRFVVEDALSFHEEDLRQSHNGSHLVIAADAPHDFESTDAPLNHGLSLARCYLQLVTLTNKTKYRETAESLMMHFYSDLEVVDTPNGEAYIWPYFTRSGINFAGYEQADQVSEWRAFRKANTRCEDSSHAVIAIEAVVEAMKVGIVFDERDMQRFGQTFLSLMSDPHENALTLTNYIDGSAGAGKYDAVAGRWAILTPWVPEIWERARNIMNKTQPPVEHATVLLSTATLAMTRSTIEV